MKSTNSEQPLVSVIMPTYNHAEFIGESVESVLTQTYKNWELIIIDNYSIDNTEEIVKHYISENKPIKYRKFSNKGVIAKSRNLGILESKGKYIAFLDSDDIWLRNKLEKQIILMESKKDIALSYVLFSQLLEDGTIKGEYPKPNDRYKGYIFNSLYRNPIIANSGVMLRRDIFSEFGLIDEDPKLVACEDFDMWLRISRKRPVDCVDHGPLLFYRVQQRNISKGRYNRWRRRMIIAKRHAPYAGRSRYFRVIVLNSAYLIMSLLKHSSLFVMKRCL